MAGQLLVFYDGPDPEQFVKGVFEFPQVLPVVSHRSDDLRRLAEERHRSLLFMGAEEAKVFFSPDFVFHYSSTGEKRLESVAAKLKQDFTVMVFFGRRFGDPVSLGRKIDPAVAAPVLIYEVLGMLKGY